MELLVFSRSRELFFKIAGVGVGFSKSGEAESIFELEQFMGWSRNPKKSSDSTTLEMTPDSY